MCVSTGSGVFVSAHTMGIQLSATQHLLGYQIDAASRSGSNCMILHLPAKGGVESVEPIDTTGAPNLLKDIAKLAAKRIGPLAQGGSRAIGAPGGRYKVVDCGIFTVVIAENAASAMAALSEVPLNKQPRHISTTLLDSYEHSYPGYLLVLACFDNHELGEGQPLLFSYTPMDPTRIFAPGLDEHTGWPPQLGKRMRREFRVIFGSALPDATGVDLAPVLTKTNNSGVQDVLRDVKVQAFHVDEMGPNGDFSLPASRLTEPYEDTVEHRRSLYTAAANIAA